MSALYVVPWDLHSFIFFSDPILFQLFHFSFVLSSSLVNLLWKVFILLSTIYLCSSWVFCLPNQTKPCSPINWCRLHELFSLFSFTKDFFMYRKMSVFLLDHLIVYSYSFLTCQRTNVPLLPFCFDCFCYVFLLYVSKEHTMKFVEKWA